MEMSIYHAYRIGVSPQLSVAVKRELQKALLAVTYVSPAWHSGGKFTVKYSLLHAFFALPMSLKRGMINFSGALRVKERVRKWVHFKA